MLTPAAEQRGELGSVRQRHLQLAAHGLRREKVDLAEMMLLSMLKKREEKAGWHRPHACALLGPKGVFAKKSHLDTAG